MRAIESVASHRSFQIFIQSPETLFSLEKAREAKIPFVVTILQKMVRGIQARKFFKQLLAAYR